MLSQSTCTFLELCVQASLLISESVVISVIREWSWIKSWMIFCMKTIISCFEKGSSLLGFKNMFPQCIIVVLYSIDRRINWCDYFLFRGGPVVYVQAVVAFVILIVRNVMEVRDREKQEFQGRLMFYDVLRAMRTACSCAQSVRNNQTECAIVSKNDKQPGNTDRISNL